MRLMRTILCACLVLGLLAIPAAASAQVSVFPGPGTRTANPQTQITFRGISSAQLGSTPITVTGSQSGVHSGSYAFDSDGQGGSFIPSTPFTSGELVTVSTPLQILGAANGTFRFKVVYPSGLLPYHPWPAAGRSRGDVQTFHSRPDLTPGALSVDHQPHGTAPGDIFVAPQWGPLQDGPMILDSRGQLLWFKSLPKGISAADFQTQTYQGRLVLTWWQGYLNAGAGVGTDVINDSSYRQIATVQAGNGMQADLHEFLITQHNTALTTAVNAVWWDTRSVGGTSHQIVLDSVVQEIDIPTGLVLFQWDSLDHVPLSDSYDAIYKYKSSKDRAPYNYFHINSVDLDDDGNLIVSARDTWTAYKVDYTSGAVIWRLGGKRSSFRLARGVYWAFQHDVRIRAQNDQFVTLFDDSAGPPAVHSQSRGIKLELDLKHMTAKQVESNVHQPPLSADYEGNVQQLPNLDNFVGWGAQPYFSEYNSRGSLIFDAHFIDYTSSYRAYRLPWSGSPVTQPAIATRSASHRRIVVYASWNGATHVRSWRVLGGSSANALRTVGTATKGGFETAITVGAQQYVAVQALDWSGRVMSTSPTVRG